MSDAITTPDPDLSKDDTEIDADAKVKDELPHPVPSDGTAPLL